MMSRRMIRDAVVAFTAVFAIYGSPAEAQPLEQPNPDASLDPASLFYHYPLTAFAEVSGQGPFGRSGASVSATAKLAKSGANEHYKLDVSLMTDPLWPVSTVFDVTDGSVVTHSGTRIAEVIHPPEQSGELFRYLDAIEPLPAQLSAAGAPATAVAYVTAVVEHLRDPNSIEALRIDTRKAGKPVYFAYGHHVEITLKYKAKANRGISMIFADSKGVYARSAGPEPVAAGFGTKTFVLDIPKTVRDPQTIKLKVELQALSGETTVVAEDSFKRYGITAGDDLYSYQNGEDALDFTLGYDNSAVFSWVVLESRTIVLRLNDHASGSTLAEWRFDKGLDQQSPGASVLRLPLPASLPDHSKDLWLEGHLVPVGAGWDAPLSVSKSTPVRIR